MRGSSLLGVQFILLFEEEHNPGIGCNSIKRKAFKRRGDSTLHFSSLCVGWVVCLL